MDEQFMYKILIIILLIAFGVILFLYIQKSQCRINSHESMQNVPNTVSNSIDRPWTDLSDDSRYHHIDLRGLERKPFIRSRRNIERDSFSNTRGPLRRIDRLYDLYDSPYDQENDIYDSRQNIESRNKDRRSGHELSRMPINNNSIPSAYDDNPDLSMCPPCVCPGDTLLQSRIPRANRS